MRTRKALALAGAMLLGALLVPAAGLAGDTVTKNGVPVDLSSIGRDQAEDALAGSSSSTAVSPDPAASPLPQIKLHGGNVQVSDPSLDHVTFAPGPTRPWVFSIESETTVVAKGNTIVAGYNSAAGEIISGFIGGVTPIFSQLFLSGGSFSTDGGRTWTSSYPAPLPGSPFTFGDPSLGIDRHGNAYYAMLGATAGGLLGLPTIQVSKTTDGGATWQPSTLVQQDNGGDKEWLAVGPDPSAMNRDNVYVTWTSFGSGIAGGQQLRFARSTDGGQTWMVKPIFTPPPDPNPVNPQNGLQSSNPYVDPITGALYVPFARFSNSDVDFIQVMVSYDGGDTFSFLNFNIPGAPDPTLLPVVQAGELIDCGTTGGLRLTIHAGTDQGGGRFGLARYQYASRLVTQPAFAARNGVLYLAWSNSTSQIFGDPNSGSNVMFVRSNDGGQTWTTPVRVNPSAVTDVHHVLPALAIDNDPNDVHVSYYTQHADETIDLDIANSRDRGATWPSNRAVRITSQSFDLPPTNTVLSGNTTTNYNRTIRPCYALGEYQSVFSTNGTQHVLWGDGRNKIMQPVSPFDPISGLVHSDMDVFYQQVKAQ